MNQSLDGAEALSVLPMDWRGTGTKIPAKARSHHWARGGIAIVSIVSLSLLMAGVGASMARAQATARGEDREGIEFYEKAIRPMLTDRCFQCHGVTVKNPKGGLVLETREGMVKGGGSGPAIVPGDPEASLLIQAIRYADEELRMPPRRRLAPEDVAAFEAWVKRGAPAPSARRAADRPAAAVPSGDLWAFRPPREPVILPKVPADYPIDAFIQAELAKRGLPHASLADRRTLLRRATYDLTGLPPRPEEIEAFLADPAPDAFAKVVDRLLASPRYGERWARHWLDLVRYTDEFDEAWRYRDWVVNAFNRDLPYDRFILHQIAGDLLAAPGPGAINADGLIATTVLAIGPWGGLDRQKRLADIVDDQIDTIGRSFLGLTVACARCHDHKFDPISTADYYGLAGFFFSSRIISDQGYLSHNPPRLKIPLAPRAEVEEHRRRMARVEEQDDKLQTAVEQQYTAFARSLLPKVADYLLASWEYRNRATGQAALSPEEFATRRGLHGFALHRWLDYLVGPRSGDFHLMDQPVRDFDGEAGVEVWRVGAERPWWAFNSTSHDVPIETFLLPPRSVSVNPGTEGGSVGWKSPITGTVGIAGRLTDADPYDGTGVSWVIDQVTREGRRELSSGRVPNGGSKRLDQGRFAGRLARVQVEAGDIIQLQVALGQGDAHYDITNVELTISCRDGPARWDLARDVGVNFLAGNPHGDSLGNGAVWHFHDRAGSHRAGRMPTVDRLLAKRDAAVASGDAKRSTIEEAAQDLARRVATAGPEDALIQDLTSIQSPFWVRDRDDARYLTPLARAELQKLASELEALRAQVPPLSYAQGIQEGGLRYGPYAGIQDARIYIRGNYSQPGRRVRRHFPEVLAGKEQSATSAGSGRLDLARWIARPDNPLTARVMVNRIWQHHFGEGIVRTPSNFGRRGEPPTHPELLDWLARRFVESGWSVKTMHRRIMLSAAYQRSSKAPAVLLEADPENRLWGRMNRRRLDAEELHDGLLALAGRLKDHMGGPADPDPSSPRRLIYLRTSRTDRSDFGSLFDRANPALHVERRTISTVAPQALYLMNHPLISEQARRLARRPEVNAPGDPAARIATLHRLVYGRPATDEEVALGCGFIARDAAALSARPEPGSATSWDRYAQALLLTNEFLFVD